MENNNISNNGAGGQAGFNQAYYQQTRLNEIFTRIDRFFTVPLMYNRDMGSYNYNIIANDLVSAYKTISAKLTKEEKKIMNKKSEMIDDTLFNNPPRKKMLDYLNKERFCNCPDAWRILKKLLLDYRDAVETLMEKYGFGNPSKKDPTKSSIDF